MRIWYDSDPQLPARIFVESVALEDEACLGKLITHGCLEDLILKGLVVGVFQESRFGGFA